MTPLDCRALTLWPVLTYYLTTLHTSYYYTDSLGVLLTTLGPLLPSLDF